MTARQNPFRSERIESFQYRFLSGGSPEELAARFAALGHRGALVGPKGTGKTTLLEELEEDFTANGWRICRWRLKRERRRPTAAEWLALERDLSPKDLLVTVDGAEQLPFYWWWRLRWVCRQGWAGRGVGGLLVTSHRPGLLTTLQEHRASPELLGELVTELLGGDPSWVSAAELHELFEAHEGNIRECLRSLYDRWGRGGCEAGKDGQ